MRKGLLKLKAVDNYNLGHNSLETNANYTLLRWTAAMQKFSRYHEVNCMLFVYVAVNCHHVSLNNLRVNSYEISMIDFLLRKTWKDKTGVYLGTYQGCLQRDIRTGRTHGKLMKAWNYWIAEMVAKPKDIDLKVRVETLFLIIVKLTEWMCSEYIYINQTIRFITVIRPVRIK